MLYSNRRKRQLKKKHLKFNENFISFNYKCKNEKKNLWEFTYKILPANEIIWGGVFSVLKIKLIKFIKKNKTS
jgi:hypothetical protein